MKRLAIGIDEVGRGALAGPVVLAAVTISGRISWRHPALGRIRDSKKLTPRRREAWFLHLTKHPALEWRVSRVTPRVIDRINIARAANLAAHRLVKRLSTNNESRTNIRIVRRGSPQVRIFAKDSPFVDEPRYFVFLDGGLKLPASLPHRTITKGDERLPIIAAASIMAKVWRDRLMTRRSVEFPAYGFHIHKGYGTRAHRRAIRRHGPSAIHRRSFLKWLAND